MKELNLYSWYFFISIFILPSCNNSKSEKKVIQYDEATNELAKMLDTNPELHHCLSLPKKKPQ